MLAHYKKGHSKFFFNVATLTHGVPIKCRKYGLKRNNNCIERDHQYSRKLEKNARGNKDIDGISSVKCSRPPPVELYTGGMLACGLGSLAVLSKRKECLLVSQSILLLV